jgi:hypothetical protein
VRLIDGLNRAQRIVVVVAIGIALAAVGLSLARIGSPRFSEHAHSYLIAPFRAPRPRLAGWLRLIIWLALTGIWAWVSVLLLRSPRGADGPH